MISLAASVEVLRIRHYSRLFSTVVVAKGRTMDLQKPWQLHDDAEIEALIQGVLDLGRRLVEFSLVTRDSRLDRQGTPESDTDHTVMLAVLACAVAARYRPALNIGKVAQYALVHDLVEAYCSDTPLWPHLDPAAKKKKEAEKKEKEKEALVRIKKEFPLFPWLHETIERYEKLGDPEARFVKALDKAMAALLHNLNDGLSYEIGGLLDPAVLQERVHRRTIELRSQPYARDEQGHAREEAVFALTIRELLMKRVIKRQWEKHTQRSASQSTPNH